MEMEGIEAARAFVDKYFPEAMAAVLGGSVARGEATAHSDLDILIITDQVRKPYRAAFRESGWFIEAFVATPASCQEKIQSPNNNRNPSFLTLLAEGILLKDQETFAKNLIERAQALLAQGLEPLTTPEIEKYRYIITDWLDDLVDAQSYDEAMFTAYDVAAQAAELLLAYHGRWIGQRKWLYRVLREWNHPLTNELMESLKQFYQTGKSESLANAVEAILNLVGGRLYEGYSDR